MARHAHGQRLHPARQRVGRRRLEDAPEQLPRRLQPVDERRAAGERAGGDVAVAVQVLRRRVHDEIDAESERLLIDRARERVVDHRDHAVRATGVGDAADVHAAERRIDRRLEPEHLRLLRQHGLRLREIGEADEARRDARARQEIGDEVQRAAVDRRAADDLVAGLHQAEERRRRRRLARRGHHRRLGAFDDRDLGFDRLHRRIRVARVDVLVRSPFLVRLELGGVREDERRRRVDRRRQRRRALAGALGPVNHVGFRMLGHGIRSPLRSTDRYSARSDRRSRPRAR